MAQFGVSKACQHLELSSQRKALFNKTWTQTTIHSFSRECDSRLALCFLFLLPPSLAACARRPASATAIPGLGLPFSAVFEFGLSLGFHHKNQATMANLPEDVLSNIFIRLSAKQLVQLRCLSSSLKSLLSESFFIKSHLNRSVNNSDGILLVWDDLYIDAKPMTAHPCRSPHLDVTNSFKLPVNPQSKDSRGRVIGSVNGLVCFEYGPLDYSNNAIYIWNPSLSAVLCLPPYSVTSKSYDCSRANYFQFGFDPKNDDYKVVNLTQVYKPKYLVKLQAEIYSMKKGSWEWTSQTNNQWEVEWVNDQDQICVDWHDGHLHWLASKWNCLETIVAFDLGAETFREILLPDSMQDDNAISNYLGVLARKLCVMSQSQNGKYEVWVMEEYGVAESWVRHHAFPPFSGDFLYPYGFTLHNEFLFRVDPHGLALYDPVSATTKLFKLHGGCIGFDKVVEYVDSLVWVTPTK